MSGFKPITAAGGVVYQQNDELEVLLIFRRGVWDLPKGKLEDDETVEECAVREVAEEIGVANLPTITFTLRDTYHEYVQNGKNYGKTTHWFGMQLSSTFSNGFNPETEEGIEKVKWVPLSEAKKIVGYENLVDVLNDFEDSFQKECK